MPKDLEILYRALQWNPPIELPSDHQWKYADQPALVEWRIRARPYNTTVANWMFVACLALAWALFFGLTDVLDTGSIVFDLFGLLILFLSLSAIYGMTHQKTKFAYRITEQAIECCKWKSPSEVWMLLLKWVTIAAAIAAFCILVMAPEVFLIALIGPGGMGLMYLSMANSDQHKSMHTINEHHIHEWSEINKACFDQARHMISLEYEWHNKHIDKILPWWLYVFCHKQDYAQNIEIIRARLGETPCSEEKVDVLAF